jgi:2-methylcitrate dehydratase PrpD
MGQELDQLHQMLQQVGNSMEAQELRIKEYEAETKRISAVQAGMTPEQIQDIVMGTIHAAIDTGDVVSGQFPRETPEMPQEMMQQMPPQGMPQ